MIGKSNFCKAAQRLLRMQGRPARRLRTLVVAAAGLALQPLSPHAAGSDEQPVTLSIANESAQPLRCMIQFAHFVVTDGGTTPANADLSIAMFRQGGDGALFIPRADGRRMMIETIDCGLASRWAATRGQISLLPARAGRDPHYSVRCRLRGTVLCDDPAPMP
jgi:hypothetical protein